MMKHTFDTQNNYVIKTKFDRICEVVSFPKVKDPLDGSLKNNSVTFKTFFSSF